MLEGTFTRNSQLLVLENIDVESSALLYREDASLGRMLKFLYGETAPPLLAIIRSFILRHLFGFASFSTLQNFGVR
jgi:hypothetical protein